MQFGLREDAWYALPKPIYVFPERKLRGLIPNSYIHLSVSDLYIPRIGIWLKQNRQTDTEKTVYKSFTET